MPSATPKADVSVKWKRCDGCGTTHPAVAACPRPWRWLVAGTRVDEPYPLALLNTKAIRVTP